MDPAFDSAAFALPLKQGVGAGAVAVRLPPHRDHQPEGRQGQGPAHPDSDRDQRARTATASTPRPTRSSGSAPSGTIRRRSTRWRARCQLPIGKSGAVQQGTRVQLGNLVVPDAGAGRSRARSAGATSPVIEASLAFYVFRLDSLQPAGVPPLAQIRPAVEHALRREEEAAGQAEGRGVPQAGGVGRVGRRCGQGAQPAAPGVRSVHPGQPAAHRSRWWWARRSGSMSVSGAGCWTRRRGCTC